MNVLEEFVESNCIGRILIHKNSRSLNHYIFRCSLCEDLIFVPNIGIKKHSGKCMTCANKLKCEKLKKRPFEALYNLFRRRNKNVKITITYEEFLEFTKVKECHYCEAPIEWTKFSPKYKNRTSAYNLDRKDPSKDYYKENCVVCCYECNLTKANRYSYEEFLMLAPTLKAIKKKRAIDLYQKSDKIKEGSEEQKCKNGVCEL